MVVLRLAAIHFEMGSIPMVSDVAIQVESNRGRRKDGFNPAMIASSTISSRIQRSKCPRYFVPVRL
jgi:hypothetical protein